MSGLTDSFSAGARAPLSGKPISRNVSEAKVDVLDEGDLHAARAEITLTKSQKPGFFYGALASGSALPFIGGPRPVPAGSKVKIGAASGPPR